MAKGKTDQGKEARERILAAIDWYWDEYGYSPCIRDIANLVPTEQGKPTSTSVINYHLDVLQSEGKITREKRIARSIRRTCTETQTQ